MEFHEHIYIEVGGPAGKGSGWMRVALVGDDELSEVYPLVRDPRTKIVRSHDDIYSILPPAVAEVLARMYAHSRAEHLQEAADAEQDRRLDRNGGHG